jgi:hypothetical protein
MAYMRTGAKRDGKWACGFSSVPCMMEGFQEHCPAAKEGIVAAMGETVLDLEAELLVRNRHMVFVKDTPPEITVKDLKKGTGSMFWEYHGSTWRPYLGWPRDRRKPQAF